MNAVCGSQFPTVAVLYARADSVYKTLPGTDVYDIERDARTYGGPWPVVAHPPCRLWGRLRHFSTAPPEEKELARYAVRMVRAHGGVLEHPERSTLWPDMGLPLPGHRDAHGGWTLPVEQHWWGHRATKATWLYVRGCDPVDVPALPLRLGEGTHVVKRDMRHNGRNRDKKHLTKPEREHTPMEFAIWLCELARRCARSMEPPVTQCKATDTGWNHCAQPGPGPGYKTVRCSCGAPRYDSVYEEGVKWLNSL